MTADNDICSCLFLPCLHISSSALHKHNQEPEESQGFLSCVVGGVFVRPVFTALAGCCSMHFHMRMYTNSYGALLPRANCKRRNCRQQSEKEGGWNCQLYGRSKKGERKTVFPSCRLKVKFQQGRKDRTLGSDREVEQTRCRKIQHKRKNKLPAPHIFIFCYELSDLILSLKKVTLKRLENKTKRGKIKQN